MPRTSIGYLRASDRGCIEIVDRTNTGTVIRLKLPAEIPGLLKAPLPAESLNLDEMDFFNVPANRVRILEREGQKCFYCLRVLNEENHVIEHVTSRPDGDNSYRNVVAACRSCNNNKGKTPVHDYVRRLFREGFLGEDGLRGRLVELEKLVAGELRPRIE